MQFLPEFQKGRVLVVGDVMLDRYFYGKTERISPEAPVPVVHIDHEEERAGGAGNVALNIAALGASVSLIGLTGEDLRAKKLQQTLKEKHVEAYLIADPSLPTISKSRVIALQQQLIRLDHEHFFPLATAQKGYEQYLQLLPTHDVVILSDYGKGTLQQAQAFIERARTRNIPVLVDPKGRDFSRYQNASLLTPNRREFETVMGEWRNEEEFLERGFLAVELYHLEALLVTRGAEGMTLFRRNKPPLHLSTQAREVFDVTGAGDTVIGTIAAALACQSPMSQAVRLANLAAGITVGKLGAAVVTPAELEHAMNPSYSRNREILNEELLLPLVMNAKKLKERIVMTNGCFDILHPGHIRYLQQARALGDRLIVAINDDHSVRALKGPTRPLNPLSDRMEMLASLASVDWVVPFSEATPERIISRILPDILVKGGDYTVEQIAGAKQVIANGGDVKILSFYDNYSTTELIERIFDRKEA